MGDHDRRVPKGLLDLDLDRLIGMTIDEARNAVERAGGQFRAFGSDDSQGLPVGGTFDLRPSRVTVIITGGRVVRHRGRG